jgi:GNAT superfamily N-acetyltransferase
MATKVATTVIKELIFLRKAHQRFIFLLVKRFFLILSLSLRKNFMSIRYYKELENGLLVTNATEEYADRLEDLQKRVFPTLSPDELMNAMHYRKHIEIFPEGQFMVLDGDKVVGATTTIIYHYSEEDHTFLDISDNLWMTTHEPESDWLYGMDVGVDSSYRKMGIARELYRARHWLCRELKLKGQLTVGMLNSYADQPEEISLEDYYDKLLTGEIKDKTVSVQQKIGFEIKSLMKNYLDDPQCGNAGALLVLPLEVEI